MLAECLLSIMPLLRVSIDKALELASIYSVAQQTTFPANFQLIGTMNPPLSLWIL
ncbi:hypothetical protein HUE58_04985 [Candidatus Ruthia endofausta]|uniref:Uncharacterized protein n=1 Tax=Candidatus Ruthia endofausta TaxID=2738852 RepID=A0A6N0HQ09_9GAMM|nr:hypothetical protein [Candidatus Ruthia endofausta]QKQ24472.1 hypothetical protein HUE58_04985 [Candidatus Ruthia endofausta]